MWINDEASCGLIHDVKYFITLMTTESFHLTSSPPLWCSLTRRSLTKFWSVQQNIAAVPFVI